MTSKQLEPYMGKWWKTPYSGTICPLRIENRRLRYTELSCLGVPMKDEGMWSISRITPSWFQEEIADPSLVAYPGIPEGGFAPEWIKVFAQETSLRWFHDAHVKIQGYENEPYIVIPEWGVVIRKEHPMALAMNQEISRLRCLDRLIKSTELNGEFSPSAWRVNKSEERRNLLADREAYLVGMFGIWTPVGYATLENPRPRDIVRAINGIVVER